MNGFATASTDDLRVIEANLLAGLDRVAASLDDGTFDAPRTKGNAPPSQSGLFTLGLLDGLRAELASREDVKG